MFYVRKPGKKSGKGHRSTFSLVERPPIGKEHTLRLEQIDSINKQYSEGKIDFHRALAMMEAVKDSLSPKPLQIFNSDNQKLLARYWKEVYSYKDLVDSDSMYADLTRAVESVGHLSLISASKEELQASLKKRYLANPNKHRRVVSRLNQLLLFAGRNFRLVKMREEFKEVRYVTEKELELLFPHIHDNNLRILCRVAFYTGLRLGELFAITERSLEHGDTLYVKYQITEDGTRTLTKNRKERRALIIPSGVKWIREWLNLTEEDRAKLRQSNHARAVKIAAMRAFSVKSKHIVFHDLRHSYAIHLLGKGLSLTYISKSLGNTISVCEKYYTGFVLSDDALDNAMRTLYQS